MIHFWPIDCRSYTHDEIFHHLFDQIINYRSESRLVASKPPCILRSISGNIIDWYWCPRDDLSTTLHLIRTYISTETIPERGLDELTCSLTLSPFKRPYLLSLNGRTYEGKAIQRAIETTLLQGQTLRLPDLEIAPWQIDQIRLYPHLSRWPPIPNPQPLTYSLSSITNWPSFRNIDIRNVPKIQTQLRLSGHSTPTWTEMLSDEGISNLTLQNIRLAAVTPFSRLAPRLTWVNCLFIGCELIAANFGACRFYSCKFSQCRVSLRDVDPDSILWEIREPVYEDCTIILPKLDTPDPGWSVEAGHCLEMCKVAQHLADRPGQFRGGQVTLL
jgi:hypothetical protein